MAEVVEKGEGCEPPLRDGVGESPTDEKASIRYFVSKRKYRSATR
jgi:hypothetical protein